MHIRNLVNLLSRLFFWWTIKLFRKGAKGDLKIEDIEDPLNPDKSKHLGDSLERRWENELKKYKQMEYTIDRDGEKKQKLYRPSLTKAIIRTFWRQCFYCGVYQFLQTLILQTMQPIFQGWVINYFDDVQDSEKPTRTQALLSASGLILTTLLIVFITHHMNLSTQRIGMQVRIACSSLIYRKSLKLSQSALDNTGAGQVINLLSNDISRFDTAFLFFNYLWIVPIQIFVIGYILWINVGVSSLVGIGALIIIAFPLLGAIAVLCGKLRGVIAEFTDQRVQLMSELVAGMQVVKMYAWEQPFDKIVSNIRRLEIKKISISSYFRGLYLSLMVFTERTILYLTIITFILMGNTLTAEISFQLASYFNTLQLTTAIFFPTALIMLGETLISIQRIENFLLLDEICKSKIEDKVVNKSYLDIQRIKKKALSNFTIEFKRVSANWIDGQLPPTLCNISLKIKDGILCSLIGPVGSGKSSFLNVLLKELPIGAGSVEFHNLKNQNIQENELKEDFINENLDIKISYASQDAWLFSGTVRENILFGQDYDRARYQQVTKVCSLMRDFQQLAHGDMTIIGERGASLSGGQRARINLARAIYQQADIYLLDDPLSAVDTRVARRLFKDCIVDFLKGKTRILVTHQLHFSRQSDMIVLLDRGIVKYQGTKFEEVLHCMEEDKKSPEDINENLPVDATSGEIFTNNQIISQRRRSSRLSLRKSSIKSIDSYYFDENDLENAEEKTKTEDETMVSGKLSTKVYIRYFREGGGTLALLLLTIFFIIAQVATSMTDYWLSYLTTLENSRISFNNSKIDTKYLQNSEFASVVNNSLLHKFQLLDEDGLLQRNYAIIIYTILIIACILLNIIRVFFFMSICMRASRKLHNEMFTNILNTTMFFFNSTPMGRILNRFSKDIGSLDEYLPKLLLESIQIFLVVCGIMTLIVIVNLWMLIPIIIIGIIFYNVRTYFLQTAQDLKRLEGIAKSPVFSHVSTTLNGLPTIRSHSSNIQEILINEFDKYQDNHTGVWYLIISVASAFGMLLDVINCIFIACVCYSFILMDIQGISSGAVGLAISQCLILTGMLQHGVRQSADVQSQMTAIERILQYTDLPKEQFICSIKSSPTSWPSRGNIQFKNFSMSYKINDAPVLKNLNFIIHEMEKVGIVGRTGAGKSSLISALFRLTDLNCLNGEIIIDGKDISKINLQDLRSNIAIIPQEPVLFSQSLRYNLDPFNKYPDSALWNALKEVEMSDYKLDEKVTEGGTNFSVGERQLICLARAILRNNKILVLDEATANIDLRTDALIQRTIRAKFFNCTVITIAHRLDTIIDSDRVIVMENGNIVEFDSPFKLLVNKPNGHFSQMVQQLGNSVAEKLLEQATKHKNTTDI